MKTSGDKRGLAAALRESALLGEFTGDNPFVGRALEQAAKVLEGLEGEPADWLAAGSLAGVKGIGKGTLERIKEWAATGKLAVLEHQRAQVPAGLPELLRIPNLGPAKIRQLWKERGIESVDALEAAIRTGALKGLTGFGPKTLEKLLASIESGKRLGLQFRLDSARAAAESMLVFLKTLTGVERVEIAGAVRRRMELCGEIEFVAASRAPQPVMDAFAAEPSVQSVANREANRIAVVLAGGMPAVLHVASPDGFGSALLQATGSEEHVAKLPRLKDLSTRDAAGEGDVYRALGMSYIEPELREGTGEIEAALSGRLPALIGPGDLKGVLHCHTVYSDGKNTVAEMAAACKAMGYRYLAICDHSQAAAYAGGLKPDRLRRQAEEIDRVNAAMKGFRVFKGTECDILADGALDFSDDVLESLDLVVCSVHSRMSLGREEMTRRICRALEHPAATILAHPTGRLLLKREPYALDIERVLETAAKHGVAIEINANPRRLDLDWRWLKQAKAAGCKIAICPDAHSIAELKFMDDYGIGVARKGWINAGDVINTMDEKAFGKYLAKKRGKS